MAPDLNTWIENGQLLIETKATDNASALIRFASEANRILARAELQNKAEAHELAAVAWGRFPEADAAVIARVRHLLLAGKATPEDLMTVVQLEVINEHPLQVRRWLDLLRLHVGEKEFEKIMGVFEAQYAQLYAQLHMAPNTIDRHDIRQLAVDADDPRRRGLVAHFKLAHAIRMGDANSSSNRGVDGRAAWLFDTLCSPPVCTESWHCRVSAPETMRPQSKTAAALSCCLERVRRACWKWRKEPIWRQRLPARPNASLNPKSMPQPPIRLPWYTRANQKRPKSCARRCTTGAIELADIAALPRS